MRWTAADGFGFPFLDLNRAKDWTQFRDALATYWGPPQNFVYADKAGNIGYQAGGRMPIRRDFSGELPLDGSSGKFEWDGYVPYEQMPSIYNPPGGMIVTANQNPFPANFPFVVNGGFADKYRVDQIRSLLKAKAKLSVDDMLAIERDVYSGFHRFLARQIAAAFERHPSNDDLVKQAVQVLRAWDGQMDKAESAPLITDLVRVQLGDALLQLAAKPPMNKNVTDVRPRPEVIEDLLRQRPAGWVAGDDWDGWLLTNVSLALQQGRNAQGSPVSKWRWGKALQWKFSHPVGHALPLLDRFFDIGPVEMSGAGTTIKQTTNLIGPSERMVVDLGNLDGSVQNLTTGESGFVASSHYKDEWPAYYTGTSFPMEFDRIDAKETLHVRPVGH